MLQQLSKIKSFLTYQLVNIKINVFIPKTYKINLINFLLLIYTNLKNNAIKTINIKLPLTVIYYVYVYLIIYYLIFELLFWLI